MLAVRRPPSLRRGTARLALAGLLGTALGGPFAAVTPRPALAAGTTIFDQSFVNNTIASAYPVSLPGLPSGATGTNTACLTARGNPGGTGPRSCSNNTDANGLGALRLASNGSAFQQGGVFGATSAPTGSGLDVTFNSFQHGAFGRVGSTGGSTDLHEINTAKVATFNQVPKLTVTQTSFSGASPQPGDPVTYTTVAGVAAGNNETSPISVTQTTPSGVVPVGAFGSGWVCGSPSGQSITCTNGNTPVTVGTALPPITVVAIVTGTGVTPSLIQSSSTATASAADADPGIATSTTAGTVPPAPSGITVTPSTGTIAGGTAVTVRGGNVVGANAIEIGTAAEQQAGTPVVLLPCASGPAAGCFTDNGDGSLSISSMPSRATAATVTITVVSDGIAGAASYVYTSAPSAPATPTATAGAGSATVTWTAPPANGSPITGYVVTPYLNGVAQSPRPFDASTTTRTLSGLTVGGTYRFTVAAVNAIGTGPAGPQSNAVVPFTVPGRPVVTSAIAGDSAATLTWTAPADGGSPITGYVVTPYIGGVAQPPQTFAGTATTQRVTGLTPGTAYTFTVTAQNAAGSGPPSDQSAAVTPNTAPALDFPPPPGGQVGVAYSDQLTVSGGTAPYTWSVSAGSLTPGLALGPTTGLLSGTPTNAGSYSFTVRIVDADGQSDTRPATILIGVGPIVFTKTADTTPAPPGSVVHYTITARNTGTAAFTGAAFTDSLAGVLDDAAYNADASATSGTVSFTSPSLIWNGDLAAGGSATITYSVTVNDPDTGDRSLANTVASTGAGANCPPGGTDPRCSVTVPVLVPQLTIASTADVTTTEPTKIVRYTTTVTNTGQVAYTNATFTFALTTGAGNVTYNNDAVASSGSVQVNPDGTLTWTGDLAVAASATVTATVTVDNPPTAGPAVATTVTSTTPGGNCPAGGSDPRCDTTVTIETPQLTITKAANVATVTPGGTVTYTVTVADTGPTSYTGATFTDSLAGVLTDAVYDDDVSATSGTAAYTEPDVTWTGDLSPGGTVTITYSVTVKNPDPGDKLPVNAVTSTTLNNNCPAGGTDPACKVTVRVLVPQLTITRSAGAATIVAGGRLTYTITVANTGETPYTGAALTDDLSGVLDEAAYDDNAVATTGAVSYAAPNLSWTGDLDIAQAATITYSVTVHNPAGGDGTLTNTITSATPGNNCPVASADTRCATSTPAIAQTIQLSDVTGAFTLTGAPGSTPQDDGAVTMTVVSNSPGGYTVGVTGTDLRSATTGDTIPIPALRVRESGTSTFHALSGTTPVTAHAQNTPSAENGDTFSNDYQAEIPFVPSGRYTATLDYIATTQ